METWSDFLNQEQQQPYYQQLMEHLERACETTTVYPERELWFEAFVRCPLDRVKVVILGQDPYHDAHQAHGLAFSVRDTSIPPSLRNMFKLLALDLGIQRSQSDLSDWAEQGVFLLNRVLTVEAHRANSHQGMGWECFTQHAISYLSEHKEHLVFVLWGKAAQQTKQWIDLEKHCVIESAHPSPLSAYRGFFESQCFSRINQQLELWYGSSIQWGEHGK
ncbi:MAG: uracil-DNA glycosylase [Erysipelotrichaceae bacterium]